MSNPTNDSHTNVVDTFTKSKKVAIYMKGTPEAPQCGFSAQACEVLLAAGATPNEIASYDIIADPSIKEKVKAHTQWPTFPQVFISGKFVGGCDIVTDLFEQGELQKLLK